MEIMIGEVWLWKEKINTITRDTFQKAMEEAGTQDEQTNEPLTWSRITPQYPGNTHNNGRKKIKWKWKNQTSRYIL